MKTTPEALKALYQTLGGSSGNVAGESKTTGILNKIAAHFGSTATADKIPDAIDNLNAVASGIVKPSGKKSITTTAETNVANYATAQISDANLVAGNIKKDVPILGVTGSYEGGGSSDFSTATVTVINNTQAELYFLGSYLKSDRSAYISEASIGTSNATILLYKNKAETFLDAEATITVSGDVAIDEDLLIVTGDCTITVSAS